MTIQYCFQGRMHYLQTEDRVTAEFVAETLSERLGLNCAVQVWQGLNLLSEYADGANLNYDPQRPF